jgi:hypothetical protein
MEIALAHGPIGGLRATAGRRTVAVVVFGYAFVLYAATELVSAVRGHQPTRLVFHLTRVGRGPGRRADDRLRHSGDLRFRQQIIRLAVRGTGVVDRLSARLHRG